MDSNVIAGINRLRRSHQHLPEQFLSLGGNAFVQGTRDVVLPGCGLSLPDPGDIKPVGTKHFGVGLASGSQLC